MRGSMAASTVLNLDWPMTHNFELADQHKTSEEVPVDFRYAPLNYQTVFCFPTIMQRA